MPRIGRSQVFDVNGLLTIAESLHRFGHEGIGPPPHPQDIAVASQSLVRWLVSSSRPGFLQPLRDDSELQWITRMLNVAARFVTSTEVISIVHPVQW